MAEMTLTNDEQMVEELLFELFPYDPIAMSYVPDEEVMKIRYSSLDRAFTSDDGKVTMRWEDLEDAFVVEGLDKIINKDIDPVGLISADTPNLITVGSDGKLLVAEEGDSFTDPRDGKKYRTVTINGVTWMAENLNYETPTSWIYNNDPANGEKYGRLYNWNEALTVAPTGWRLPTRNEWQALVDFAGGNSAAGRTLKSTSGWNSGGNGTDDYGFSALPGGLHYPNGSFEPAGDFGYWWTATGYSNGEAYSLVMGHIFDNVYDNYISKSYGLSMRLVKDYDFSTTETDTGKRWIDGKPIYRKVFTGTATVNAKTLSELNLTAGIAALVSCGGWWQVGAVTRMNIGEFDNNTPTDITTAYYSVVAVLGAGPTNFKSYSPENRTNAPYEIWIEYTKR
jgi:uncharacterized protein (TIGR02145 family)